jgi:hypothetical protein
MKANQSVKSLAPKSSSALAYQIDQITQSVVNQLMCLQRLALPGDKLSILPSLADGTAITDKA